LQNIIEEEEEKPLPDDQGRFTQGKGLPYCQRTIAKYREQLDIPVARMREKNQRLQYKKDKAIVTLLFLMVFYQCNILLVFLIIKEVFLRTLFLQLKN
jgi:hypothetical protein